MNSMIRKILIFFIRIYQIVLRPLIPTTCRFYPSCSEYCKESILVHGIGRGILLGIWRILRCQPFSHGGLDMVKKS